MVLIGGVGRSGTHLMANILKSHPRLEVDVEVEPQFTHVVNSVIWGRGFSTIVDIYSSKSPNYVTKDHPAMWHFDMLTTHIKDFKMILLHRNIKQVVASSLSHMGVLQWVIESGKYPPNPLSGSLHPAFNHDLPIVRKLALRWWLHKHEIDKYSTFPNVLIVNYDDILLHPDDISVRLSNFLGVPNYFAVPKLNYSALTKWRQILTLNDLRLLNED